MIRKKSHSLAFLVYAAFGIAFDSARGPAGVRDRDALMQLLGAMAFSQQWLIFHLHSTDHMGVEGQYHWLLQLVIVVSPSTTLAGMAATKSFVVAFVWSLSIAFQGVWLVIMGYMLWTPSLLPKDCFLNNEEGHEVLRCHTDDALHRAKALVNLEFSWFLTAISVLAVLLYLVMSKVYPEEPQYLPLMREDVAHEDELDTPKELMP